MKSQTTKESNIREKTDSGSSSLLFLNAVKSFETNQNTKYDHTEAGVFIFTFGP